MARSSTTRLLDRLEEHSAEAVALVASLVLLLGVVAVASDREGLRDDRLAADAAEPTAPAPPSVPDLGILPTDPVSAPATPAGPSRAPATPTPAASPAVSASPDTELPRVDEPAGDAGRRVVVLGVDAPSAVAAGESVTFRISVRGTGGTPVLTFARFGDGATGGTPAPCAGSAGPSFRGDLEITHTYATAGTYSPYFIASLPCGPSSGAGTSVTVTGGGVVPTAGSPAGSPSPSASPTPTAPPTTQPAPSGTSTPSA